MTTIIDLISHEEGFRDRPYLCSEHFPTVGYGFRLGPRMADPEKCRFIYDFTLPRPAANAWLEYLVEDLSIRMTQNRVIAPAWLRCDMAHADMGYMWNPRLAVLISMAYQMGVDGLAGFPRTLKHVAVGDFELASENMLQSKWAKQTPNRARRHAEQMKTGRWAEEYRK